MDNFVDRKSSTISDKFCFWWPKNVLETKNSFHFVMQFIFIALESIYFFNLMQKKNCDNNFVKYNFAGSAIKNFNSILNANELEAMKFSNSFYCSMAHVRWVKSNVHLNKMEQKKNIFFCKYTMVNDCNAGTIHWKW